MRSLIVILAVFLLTGCYPNRPSPYAFSTRALHTLNHAEAQKILNKKVTEQGVVFVVPYRLFKKEGKEAIAIFLGRERIDGKKPEKRGMWSEFGGGSSESPTSLYDNLNREFVEETMGQLKLNPQAVKEKGLLFFSISQKTGRPYWGVAYPLTEKGFQKTLTFNKLRNTPAFTQSLCAEQLEKDLFYWFDLEDVIRVDKATQPIRIKPLFIKNAPFLEIKLRSHFTKFFLNHPAFQEFLQQVFERIDAAA